ncbi:sensor histidine kinase [Kordia jejudonensis]|uniref:sensor histidine kinase n=1 Tax=Kordia jejudonensis TaxID=1348245 RepID=UPI000629067C|nr:ATP-binding protein [Kordia jejudonensis]
MKKLLSFLLITISQTIFSQEIDDVVLNMKVFDIVSSKEKIQLLDSNQVASKYLRWQLDLLMDENKEQIDSIEKEIIKFDHQNSIDSILSHITLGDLYRKKTIINDTLVLKNYLNAVSLAKKTNDTIFICESYKKVFRSLYKSRTSSNLYLEYIEDYSNYVYDVNEKATYLFYKYYYLAGENQKEYIEELKQGFSLIEDSKNEYLKIKYLNIIGVNYNFFIVNKDSAVKYYKIAGNLIKKSPYKFIKKELISNQGNLAILFKENGEYQKALSILKKLDLIDVTEDRVIEKVKINELIGEIYQKQKKYDSAYFYLNRKIKYLDLLNEYEKSIAISEIDKKFKTEELTADKNRLEELNIINEAEKNRKNSQLIISLIVLALVIISAYFIQKNTRKKQLLAEQAKDLEAQKVSTLLKEQELASIDAMIEGQEKERKRIAEDLHDDLGALMATINLHLENIGSENNPNALDKTKVLLGEAYEKIRNMSHVKNAGVIANQGLLVAVNNMTSKIKSANKIDIEVIAYGLENRLENSLELSLFRMIQELITNMIKHAEATKATIQLTQHEKNLNIIVEDNGKGFDYTNSKDVGIGLENIKKRIKHLNGSLSIDSTLGKGATFLIDVPLS